MVDVKPLEFASSPDAQRILAWTALVCRTAGWGYEVWTGADPVVLANIRSVAVARRFLRPGRTASQAGGCVLSALAEVWSGRRPVDLTVPLTTSDLRLTGEVQ